MNRLCIIQALTLLAFATSVSLGDKPVRVGWCVDNLAISHYCEIDEDWYEPKNNRKRILLIQAAPDIDFANFARHLRGSKELGTQMMFASIPIPKGMDSLWPEILSTGFPPSGEFYKGKDALRQYLWRFIGAIGTDAIVLVRQMDSKTSTAYPALLDETSRVSTEHSSLFASATMSAPGKTGLVASIEHPCQEAEAVDFLKRFYNDDPSEAPSSAEVVRSRQRRPTNEICERLINEYATSFRSMSYIPALTLRAKHRFGLLTLNAKLQQQVLSSVTSYADANPNDKPKSGSAIGGHLIYSYLASQNHRDAKKWIDYSMLALKPALAFEGNSEQFLMPFHNEMSDAVFMSGPLLAEIADLTDSYRLKSLCTAHITNMAKMNLRPDGLHRHSPLDSAAWGRGNGFPALGLAISLDALGSENQELLALYKDHVDALLSHQDAAGMWHQVVDHPGSYAEFTSTCMIGYSILRGIRNGWLKEIKYQDAVSRAANAIKGRIGEDGSLFDVCTGTGKQKTLMDYFHRTAILGKDARGGAMALTFMVELYEWELSGHE